MMVASATMFGVVVSFLMGVSFAQNEANTWKEFNLAFGQKKMISAVGTVEQLSLAIQHENKVTTNGASEAIAKFACASYQNGTDLCAWARNATFSNASEVWMSPVFVSDEDDLLCLIVRSTTEPLATEILSRLSFIVTLPSQMKLEPNVLNLIENLSDDPTQSAAELFSLFSSTSLNNMSEKYDDMDLTISYYSNATTIYASSALTSPNIDVENNRQRSAESTKNLRSYFTSSLNTFYWAESASAGQDFNNSVSRNVDRWDEFAEVLDTQTSSSSEDNDLCRFGKLGAFDVEGDTIVPLASLLSVWAPQDAGACFAFLVSEFAADPMVAHIALTSRPVLLNFRARSIQQFGNVGTSDSVNPFTTAGLDGFDQVVGVTDTGLDEQSCYFVDSSAKADIARGLVTSPYSDLSRRKVVQYSYLKQADTKDMTAGHGTHVAGTVAGFNMEPLTSGGKYSGVAPNAKIAFLDIASSSGSLYIPKVNEQYSALKLSNAHVCTNSWGGKFSKSGGYYAGGKIDDYLFKNMDTLILFANGNSGLDGLETVSREACSKNVVSVGASESDSSENIDYVAYFSSLGPTYDKRIKPDIVAPGAGLVSAQASNQNSNEKTCDTTFKQGTSMASPAAAGAALLIRQYFQDKDKKFWTKACNPSDDLFCTAFTPTGMLLKALLIHSGESMSLYREGNSDKDVKLSNSGKPDVYQGYGRVQLSNILPLPGKTSFQLTVRDMVDIAEKSSVTHHFKVTDSLQPLVVTICWYDPPAVSGAAKALMHDLDLILKLPDGKGKILGNLESNRDTVNNVERIVIKNPDKGKYQAKVKARALPVSGRQRFSFVLTYAGTPLNAKEIDEYAQALAMENLELEYKKTNFVKIAAARAKAMLSAVANRIHNFLAGIV